MDWTNAFAKSDTTKLFLDPAQKFWISVRDELSHAEQRAINLGSFRRIYRDNEELIELDPRAGADHKVLAYLVDWNVVGSDGKTIAIDGPELKRDAVKNLKPEFYRVIEKTIDEHVVALQKKKELTSGPSTSSATSDSAAGSESVG